MKIVGYCAFGHFAGGDVPILDYAAPTVAEVNTKVADKARQEKSVFVNGEARLLELGWTIKPLYAQDGGAGDAAWCGQAHQGTMTDADLKSDEVKVREINRASAAIQNDRDVDLKPNPWKLMDAPAGTHGLHAEPRPLNRVHEMMTRVNCGEWMVRVWSIPDPAHIRPAAIAYFGPDRRVIAALKNATQPHPEITGALEALGPEVVAAYEILDRDGNGSVTYPDWK